MIWFALPFCILLLPAKPCFVIFSVDDRWYKPYHLIEYDLKNVINLVPACSLLNICRCSLLNICRCYCVKNLSVEIELVKAHKSSFQNQMPEFPHQHDQCYTENVNIVTVNALTHVMINMLMPSGLCEKKDPKRSDINLAMVLNN